MVSFTIQDRPDESNPEALTNLLWLLKATLLKGESTPNTLGKIVELVENNDISAEETLFLKDALSALPSPDGYPEELVHANMWVLRAGMPNLDALISRFDQFHRLGVGEAYWIMDGEGVFGLKCPDGPQFEVRLGPGHGIYIPAGVERYFHPTATLRVKILRLRSVDGPWVPQYTDSQREILG